MIFLIRILLILSSLVFLPASGYSLEAGPNLTVYVATADTPDYIKEWISTRPEHPIHIKRVHEIGPNKTIYISIVVSGFDLNKLGSTDLIGSLFVINPKNEKIMKQIDQHVHKHIMKKRGFVMLDPAIDFTLEKTDPPGIYVFRAEVLDRVSNKKAMGEWRVLLRAIK